jgi:hypothetical protein
MRSQAASATNDLIVVVLRHLPRRALSLSLSLSLSLAITLFLAQTRQIPLLSKTQQCSVLSVKFLVEKRKEERERERERIFNIQYFLSSMNQTSFSK